MLKKAFQSGFKIQTQLLNSQVLCSFAKATLKLPAVKTHLIKKSKIPTKAKLTSKEGLDMLRDMLTIRKMET